MSLYQVAGSRTIAASTFVANTVDAGAAHVQCEIKVEVVARLGLLSHDISPSLTARSTDVNGPADRFIPRHVVLFVGEYWALILAPITNTVSGHC